MKVECVCINAKGRPPEVPPQMWISEGIEYHITHVSYLTKQGIQGVLLEEVRIKDCPPYEFYRLDRFAFTEKGIAKLIELIEACTELNKIDIQKLIEESHLEIIKTQI